MKYRSWCSCSHSLPPPFCPLCNRMIPPSSKNFLVNNLAAGTQYDLCVLAIYDDVITSLTATRVVGCVQFTTESEYMRCHFMQSQFLGGTMIIIIGGIIVASVLVFIIILMIRYKVGLSVSPYPPERGKRFTEVPNFDKTYRYSYHTIYHSIQPNQVWFYIFLYDYHVSLTKSSVFVIVSLRIMVVGLNILLGSEYISMTK